MSAETVDHGPCWAETVDQDRPVVAGQIGGGLAYAPRVVAGQILGFCIRAFEAGWPDVGDWHTRKNEDLARL